MKGNADAGLLLPAGWEGLSCSPAARAPHCNPDNAHWDFLRKDFQEEAGEAAKMA